MIALGVNHILKYWRLFIFFAVGISISLFLAFFAANEFNNADAKNEQNNMSQFFSEPLEYSTIGTQLDAISSKEKVYAIDINIGNGIFVRYGAEKIGGENFANKYENEMLIPLIDCEQYSLNSLIIIENINYRVVGYVAGDNYYLNEKKANYTLVAKSISIKFESQLNGIEIDEMRAQLRELFPKSYVSSYKFDDIKGILNNANMQLIVLFVLLASVNLLILCLFIMAHLSKMCRQFNIIGYTVWQKLAFCLEVPIILALIALVFALVELGVLTAIFKAFELSIYIKVSDIFTIFGVSTFIILVISVFGCLPQKFKIRRKKSVKN